MVLCTPAINYYLKSQERAQLDIAMNGFWGAVVLKDVLLMFVILIHLPLLTVPPSFLLHYL